MAGARGLTSAPVDPKPRAPSFPTTPLEAQASVVLDVAYAPAPCPDCGLYAGHRYGCAVGGTH